MALAVVLAKKLNALLNVEMHPRADSSKIFIRLSVRYWTKIKE